MPRPPEREWLHIPIGSGTATVCNLRRYEIGWLVLQPEKKSYWNTAEYLTA